MKRIVAVAIVVLVAFGVGWVWGISGRSAADRALRDSELRRELLDGRMAVLDARLDIYSVNFGNASQHFENAKTLLRNASGRLASTGRQDEAKRIDDALRQIEEAQRLASRLDQGANSKAATAAQAINEVLKTTTLSR